MMQEYSDREFAVVDAFDRILIAVPDLEAACDEYRLLLGAEAEPRPARQGEPEAWLALGNTVLALRQGDSDSAVIQGLVLRQPGSATRAVENPLGLAITVCDGSETAEFRQAAPQARSPDVAVDHLVLRTGNAQGCIDLFAAELGIRLALDKTVPEWGGRMLFFRAGKMTLEVIESDADGSAGDFFWGIAFQHAKLDLYGAALNDRGVALSSVREGRKPGTRVATVKSHCLGLPTLLIEPAK